MEQMLTVIAGVDLVALLRDNPFILAILTVIVGLFLFYLARLEQVYRAMLRALKQTNADLLRLFQARNGRHLDQILQNSSDQRYKVGSTIQAGQVQRVMASHGLDALWGELRENLIWFYEDPQPRIGQVTAHYYLAPTSLRTRFIPERLENRGSLLTAIGVLGTFLGLTYGLAQAGEGLSSPHLSEARSALAELLRGAKMAFTTSLAGLTCSLIYNVRVEWLRDRAANRTEALGDTLKAYFPVLDPTYAAAQQMVSVNDQVHAFKAASDRNQQAIVAELQNLSTALQELLPHHPHRDGTEHDGSGQAPSGDRVQPEGKEVAPVVSSQNAETDR